MCSAIHLPSAHSSTYDCETRGRLYGPITSSTWKKWVKASRLKCAIASSIDTSTVRPTPVRPRSISAPEDAVGGVEAGQRIGDRRADDARVLGIDEQVEEAARRLRDGVVGGAVGAPGRSAPKPLIEQ